MTRHSAIPTRYWSPLLVFLCLGLASAVEAQSSGRLNVRPLIVKPVVVDSVRPAAQWSRTTQDPTGPTEEAPALSVENGEAELQEPDPASTKPDSSQTEQESGAGDANDDDRIADIVRKQGNRPFVRPITDIRIDIGGETGRKPEDRSQSLLEIGASDWSSFAPSPSLVVWDAPNLVYRGLYFEDPILERYGQCKSPVQDVFRSGVHFSAALVKWPLRGLADAPGVCETPLGYCRPGTALPCYKEPLSNR